MNEDLTTAVILCFAGLVSVVCAVSSRQIHWVFTCLFSVLAVLVFFGVFLFLREWSIVVR